MYKSLRTTCLRKINLSEMHMNNWSKKKNGGWMVCPIGRLIAINNLSIKG